MTLPTKPEHCSLRIKSNAPLCPAGGGLALVWSRLRVGEGERRELTPWKRSYDKHQFSSVQSLSRVRLFATP